MKKRQKRIAVINDVTGFGRCSVSVAQPIISACKIQCCALPTAILSSNTAFKDFVFDDYTEYMKKHMAHWKELGITFDGIATGFLGSTEQISVVKEFLKQFKAPETIVLIDPVMGDDGILYSTYTDDMCDAVRELLPYGNILTPNLTEACRLLRLPYPKRIPTKSELTRIAMDLSAFGPDKIVITGLQTSGKIINFYYEKGKQAEWIVTEKVGEDRSGTGDVFSSIVIANLVNGKSFSTSIKKAARFIHKTIVFTNRIGVPLHDGICFEEYLTTL